MLHSLRLNATLIDLLKKAIFHDDCIISQYAGKEHNPKVMYFLIAHSQESILACEIDFFQKRSIAPKLVVLEQKVTSVTPLKIEIFL